MKKIVCLVLICIMLLCIPVAAFGQETLSAEEYNAQIAEQIALLQTKYNIEITYPLKTTGYAGITQNNLITLDTAFSTVTPEIISEISDFYKDYNGQQLKVAYAYSEKNFAPDTNAILALFSVPTATIYILLPSKSGVSVVSGDNPIAIVHELGHAFHLMAITKYGEQKMQSKWEKFNRGLTYDTNIDKIPNKQVFISPYAATSYEEDFAEVFAGAFIRNHAGMGIKNNMYRDEAWTGLGEKVNFVRSLFFSCFADCEAAMANYEKIYKTPVSYTFEDTKFSGEYLQYIGYPQPKNVLSGLLSSIGITSEKTTWVRDLGAWRVITPEGKMYFVFPGGMWFDQGAAAAAA